MYSKMPQQQGVRGENRKLYAIACMWLVVVLIGMMGMMVVHTGVNRNHPSAPLVNPNLQNEQSTPISFSEFMAQYQTVGAFLTPTENEEVAKFIADHKLPTGDKMVGCPRVDMPMRDLPTVPFPQAWCDDIGEDAPKTYLWLIGDAFSGTTGSLSMLVNAANMSSLCIFKDGEPFKLCEGFKYLAPPSVMEHRMQDYWPKDMKVDVIDKWESLWNEPNLPIRVDKSPPWGIKVGQIIDDLNDRDGTRIAFIYMTRSKCSTHDTAAGLVDRFAMQYEYILRRRIPVMHMRYEDFAGDLDEVKRKVHAWCPCLSIPARTGFAKLQERLNGEAEEAAHAGRDRLECIEDYLSEITPSTLQQPYDKGLREKHVASLKYFGYPLEPTTKSSG